MTDGPVYTDAGGVLQSGIPGGDAYQTSPQGLLVRGVVIATYVTDDPDAPFNVNGPTTAVYCDVLTYSMGVGGRFHYLIQVLVLQDQASIQGGRIWLPRATTMDVTGNELDVNVATNPADMDGDHVLIGFIDNNMNQPVILGSVPHPAADIGQEGQPIGKRTRLVLADGDPAFRKHKGSYYGLDASGNHVVDLTSANAQALQNDGSEAPLAQDGSAGNATLSLEQHAQRLVQLMDMSTPTSPQAVMQEVLELASYVLDYMSQTVSWQVKAGSNNALDLQNSGSATTLKVGDGSQHVTIYEHLQNFYANTLAIYLNGHTHPTSTGPSGPPAQTAPTFDSTIKSNKVSIPDG